MNFGKFRNTIQKNSLLDKKSDIAFRKIERTTCDCSEACSSTSRAKRVCSSEDQDSSPSSRGLKNSYNLGCKPSNRSSRICPKLEVDPQEIETGDAQTFPEKSQTPVEEHKEALEKDRVVIQRRNRTWRLDISDRLPIIRRIIIKNNIGPFKNSTKKTRYTKNKYLGRRSKYIGVTKNNVNWQALINVDHEKKYIGTFVNELEAAKTYDLYAIAMQGKRAHLNFSYTSEEMVTMIDHYLAHRRINIDEHEA
ncbi:unnamed protein product [Moneuplotes crassus]|uniref:AP2/ERF domain-containing protein n=1 Tax=Euplotes crassus TaxID=5936 RepID=A0AAD1U849_EUPCR|nr:unnamed protein product [Moneuplotes crassus]